LIAAAGPRENHHIGKTIEFGENISHYVAERKEPFLMTDVVKSNGLFKKREESGSESFMSCPVLVEGSVIGVINVAGRAKDRPFVTEDLLKFQTLAERCSGTLISLRRGVSPPVRFPRTGKLQQTESNLEEIEQKLREFEIWNANALMSPSRYVLVFDCDLRVT
jgi:hypothetical protein